MRTGTLFGGKVRSGVLEVLASTSKPLSAYRVAKVIGAQPIQVLTILKSLEPDVTQRTDAGWVMRSDSLRRFLRDELYRRELDRRTEKDELLNQLGLKPRPGRGRG